MMDDIDRIVLQNDVQNIDDLIAGLYDRGYEVKQQKYISIKPPHGKHFIRSFRLGDGYSLECLSYRIANKDKEMSAEELSRYDGIQYRYALCLRELQLILYRRQESSIRTTYYEVVRSAELLCYMVNNHITTDEGFKLHVNERDEKYQAAVSRRKDIERKIAFEEKILSESGRFLELWNKEKLTPRETTELGRFQVLIDYKIYEDGELDKHRVKLSRLREELEAADSDAESAKAERKTAADNYRFYLEQMQDDFYAILERKKTDEARKERDLRIMEEYDRAKTGYQKENKEEGRNDRR
jgi:hypothetical protein